MTVANALEYIGDANTRETIRFVKTFDRFFDMLNTRSIEESKYKNKSDLACYRSAEDKRLKVASSYILIACTS